MTTQILKIKDWLISKEREQTVDLTQSADFRKAMELMFPDSTFNATMVIQYKDGTYEVVNPKKGKC